MEDAGMICLDTNMIAATAMVSGARLATSNRDDFSLFAPYGLQLFE